MRSTWRRHKDFRFTNGRGATWPSWELLRDQVTLHWAGGIQHPQSCQVPHHSSFPSEPLSRPTLDSTSWQVVYHFRPWAHGSFLSHLWPCFTLWQSTNHTSPALAGPAQAVNISTLIPNGWSHQHLYPLSRTWQDWEPLFLARPDPYTVWRRGSGSTCLTPQGHPFTEFCPHWRVVTHSITSRWFTYTQVNLGTSYSAGRICPHADN